MTSIASNRKAENVMFTVVIGTFNGARTLGTALDALEAQVTEFNYEILVVNDASTDETRDIASRPRVRLINLEENQGHGHTLNVGLAESHGAYMAMMDDDCVPPPQWIQQLGIAWHDVGDDVTVIGGIVEPYETDSLNRRYVAYRRPLRHQEEEINESTGFWTRLRHQLSPVESPANPRAVYYAVGANMSVRVDAARGVGGFSDARGSGEEESLARPLRKAFGTGTVRLFPHIVMYHDFDVSLRDTLRRSRSYGRTNGRRWAQERSIPSLSPLLPCAVLGAAVVAIVSPVASIVAFIFSPLVLYRRWITWFKKDGSGEAIVYPYIQAGEDIANNIGFIQGAWLEVRKRHQ